MKKGIKVQKKSCSDKWIDSPYFPRACRSGGTVGGAWPDIATPDHQLTSYLTSPFPPSGYCGLGLDPWPPCQSHHLLLQTGWAGSPDTTKSNVMKPRPSQESCNEGHQKCVCCTLEKLCISLVSTIDLLSCCLYQGMRHEEIVQSRVQHMKGFTSIMSKAFS